MSRIHEALKKASQSPAGSHGLLPDVDEIITTGAEMQNMEVSTPATSAETLMPSDMLPSSDAALAHALFANCVRGTWPQGREALVFLSEDSVLAGKEQFRTLRSRLYQMRSEGELKIIAVSSAIPGEGKSFVSTNLAHAFAMQSGRKVLLIDADLRRIGGLSGVLQSPSSPGLVQYLQGKHGLEGLIHTGSIERLYFIPSGERVAQTGELVGDPKFVTLLEKVRPLFDWIIIDTPPVLPTADARVIADMSDGVLLVVNSSGTPSFLAKRAAQEFRRESLLGVVLNRAADPTAARYPGYGYGYGYGYGAETALEPEDRSTVVREK
jgi:capsular exopolysaccharide synthesis family protein